MKPYRILRDFAGSQTGNDGPFYFRKDEIANLSDHLAEVVLKEGWVEPFRPDTITGGPHPKLVPDPGAPNVLVTTENRETKVTGPEETKPFDIARLNKKDLVTFAKDNFGLELDEGMKKDDLLAAIDAHTAGQAA